jgi:cystathionine gamma-lyase
MSDDTWEPQTRAVHGGLPAAANGRPFLEGPTFAAPFHLGGDPEPGSRAGYGRFTNPTWEAYERALGELEGGDAVVFSSGMAAITAALMGALRPGDVLVAPSDSYPGVRTIATGHLEPAGVTCRLVPTDERAVREALPGASVVWVESPSNPGLDVLELGPLAADVHAAGALLMVDNTLAGPLRVRPLEHGADLSMVSGSKQLTGHSDLILGACSTRDPERLAALRTWRTTTGSIPGPFEVWLAHRSLATLGVRTERQEATAAALCDALRARADVEDVRWPGVGPVVCFTLAGAARAQAFLAACSLLSEATSFGGVHTSAERRGRWGTDDVADGFIRLSVGVEATGDVVSDVLDALDRC